MPPSSPDDRAPATSPFPRGFFDRQDESADTRFYPQPRFVTHIDDGAIAAVGEVFAEVGVPGRVLDLCSSWVSHGPVTAERRPTTGRDPLWAVWARREV